jgi:ATP-dependent Clp endopeptidase proteolytic subunit ClpP
MPDSSKKSKKEIDASISKTLAEAQKIQAEAEKIKLEQAKIALDIERLKIYNQEAALSLDKKQREERREKAHDEENMVYRFNTVVDKTYVNDCMHKLTQWSRRHPKCDMEIVFSSGGGSIIDGFVLFDFIQELRGRGHKVTTGSLGMAASMAGILLQAGDHRWMGHQAWMMIHRAAFGAIGKTFEIEDEVAWIKRIEDRILEIFEKKSSLTRTKIKRNWDRKDWWISSDEALEMGLIDEIRGEL